MEMIKQPRQLFIFTVIGAVLSMLVEVDLWISGVCLGLVCWRFFLKQPSRTLTGILAMLFFGAVFFKYRTFLGRDPAACFLVLLTCLKVLENNGHRDEKFLFLLGIFMIVGKFLFTLDFIVAFVHLILLCLLLWSFLKIQTPHVKPQFLVKQLIFSVPIAMVIFFLFPRYSNNFKGFIDSKSSYGQNGSGFSGFAEDLRPGNVSQVLQSDDLVFRAKFRGSEPRPQDLYWRGDVLEQNLGFTWKKNSRPEIAVATSSEEKKSQLPTDRVSYQIIIEPHQHRWAFSLERSLVLQGDFINASGQENGVYAFDYPVVSRQTYSGESQIEGYLSFNAIKKWNKQNIAAASASSSPAFLLQTTPHTPGVQKLIQLLKKDITSKTTRLERVQIILNYFANNGFQYSLSPNNESHDLEGFLLRGKMGFCEHYSAAFTSLARALGVPARVVVGYHGGTYNGVGGFWNISQKNAHAWSEVLIESQTWIRIDPTSALPEVETRGLFNMASMTASQKNRSGNFFVAVYDNIALLMDTMNYRWNEFFLDFDQNSTKEIYDDLASNLKSVGLALLFVLLFYFGINGFFTWMSQRKKRYRIDSLYEELSHVLRRPKHFGPAEWRQSLQANQHALWQEASQIIDCYIQKTYALAQPSKAEIAELQKPMRLILSQLKKN